MSIILSRIRSHSFLSLLSMGAALALVVLGASLADAQSYDFLALDDPSASPGNLQNGGGTLASGLYGDTVVGLYTHSGSTRGFIETGGVWTNLDYKTSAYNSVTGIDTFNGNTIVGGTIIDFSSGTTYGWWSHTGTPFAPTDIKYPNATFTSVGGIYDNVVVGTYEFGSPDTAVRHGFTYNILTDVYSDLGALDDPAAGQGAKQGTLPIGIYENTIVGTYVDASGVHHGFSETGGNYDTVDYPNATGESEALGIYGDTVVGFYGDFQSGPLHGFTETNDAYTTLDPPGSTVTEIFGIYGNTVVGVFDDGAGNEHGFIATPVPTPEPGSVALLFGLGVTGLSLLARRHLRRS